MRSMGNAFLSIIKGNFNSAGASMRPKTWKAKADGKPSILQQSTLLSKSFHLTVSAKLAMVANPTPYAAIHQFGGAIKGKPWLRFKAGDRWATKAQVTIPARPFYPVIDGKLTPAAAQKISAAGIRAINRALHR
jgi:phage gpG-like protein